MIPHRSEFTASLSTKKKNCDNMILKDEMPPEKYHQGFQIESPENPFSSLSKLEPTLGSPHYPWLHDWPPQWLEENIETLVTFQTPTKMPTRSRHPRPAVDVYEPWPLAGSMMEIVFFFGQGESNWVG